MSFAVGTWKCWWSDTKEFFHFSYEKVSGSDKKQLTCDITPFPAPSGWPKSNRGTFGTCTVQPDSINEEDQTVVVKLGDGVDEDGEEDCVVYTFDFKKMVVYIDTGASPYYGHLTDEKEEWKPL